MRNPFKRRTRPLKTGAARLVQRIAAANRQLNNPEALEARRCAICGGFLNINRECRKCQ